MDTIRVTRDSESATCIHLGIRLNPDGIRKAMPDFAKYLDKYVTPAKYRTLVTDKRGGRWVEIYGDDNYMTMRMRSIGGHFAPLNGPVRPLPDELQITSDFTTKILFFTVGFTKLVGDITTIDSNRERGWFIRFTKEPDWRLPAAVSFMIHTPLKRPFKQGGVDIPPGAERRSERADNYRQRTSYSRSRKRNSAIHRQARRDRDGRLRRKFRV